jgi:allantoin racemase
MLADNVLLYGLEGRCASIRFLSMPVLELETQKDRQAKRLLEEAKRAVEEDGADTIVLGCGSMFGVEEKVRQALNVPVVVPGPVALKTCESLITLDLAQSKRFFTAPPSKKRVL